MKWVLIVVVGLACLGGLVAIVGSRLPSAHTVSRTEQFGVPPEALWQVITDVDAFPSWRADVTSVERLPDREGRPVWIEHSRSDRLTLAVERTDPPRLLVVRIADPELPFGGTWTYEVAQASGGSRLTITENGEVYNPIFRFVARYVLGHEGTITAYIKALRDKLARG